MVNLSMAYLAATCVVCGLLAPQGEWVYGSVPCGIVSDGFPTTTKENTCHD
jgi:hypothetical protein